MSHVLLVAEVSLTQALSRTCWVVESSCMSNAGILLCRFVLARDNDMEMGPLQEQPHSPAPVRPPKPSLASLAERPHPPPQGYRPQPDPWRVGAQI